MILHTINKSPFSSDAFSSCTRIAADNDFILLIEDGVYALLGELPEQKLYVLKADLEARGLANKTPAQVTVIDYDEFVQLSTEATAVQSWY